MKLGPYGGSQRPTFTTEALVSSNSQVGERLGLKPGNVVQELGWDSDVDESVSKSRTSSTLTLSTVSTATLSTPYSCGGETVMVTLSMPSLIR